MGKKRKPVVTQPSLPWASDDNLYVQQGYYHVGVGPSLLSWLCCPNLTREGGRTDTNTFTIWFDGTTWRMSLHWRSARVVSYLSHADLDMLFLEADSLLATGELHWRPSPAE